MKHAIKILSLIVMIGLLIFSSCSDDDPSAVTIMSATSTGTDLVTGNSTTVDLNTATAPTNVPPDGVITITFSKEVDATTVNSTSITLAQGTTNVPIAVVVVGNKVTITPTNELVRGTLHTLSISGAIKGSDGGILAASSRTFTTAGTAPAVVPKADKLVVYLPFNSVVEDEFNHTILNNEVTLGTDRFGNIESSATFNGTTNYVGIQYGADMSNASTTVSYWIKPPASADYATHIGIQRYVTFAIGGNNGTFHEFGRFDNSGTITDFMNYFTNHVNSGSASSLAGSSIEMKNEGNPQGDRVVEVNNIPWLESNTGKWMHIVTSWNAATRTKSFYVNGVPSTVYTLTPSAEYALNAATIDVTGIDLDATNSKNLYLGSGVPYWATKTATGITPFRGGVPHAFKGQMDDFRMFSVALTNAEVLSLYNAEKP